MSKKTWQAGRQRRHHKVTLEPPRKTSGVVPKMPLPGDNFYRRDLLSNGKLRSLWQIAYQLDGQAATKQMAQAIVQGTYGMCKHCMKETRRLHAMRRLINWYRIRLHLLPQALDRRPNLTRAELSWVDLGANPLRETCTFHSVMTTPRSQPHPLSPSWVDVKLLPRHQPAPAVHV